MKKFFSLLTLALLTMSAWAAKTVTIDFAAQGYTNGQEVTTVTDADELVTLTFDKGTNTNSPKYYNTGAAVRLYGGGTLTVSVADGSDPITGITFTFGSGDGTNAITSNVGTFNSPDWTGSANAVTFTVGGTTGHRRIAKVEVTLGGEVVETVADPVFTPGDGTSFIESQEITLTCGTAGATISYSTDGLAWNTYEDPITITETTTVYAKAAKNNVESNVVTATYTKVVPAEGNAVIFKSATDQGDGSTTRGEWTVVKNGVTLHCSDGTVYTDSYRIYGGSTFTISSNETAGKIVKIEFVNTDSSRPISNMTPDTGILTSEGAAGTWVGDETNSVEFSVSAQARASEIHVYVTGDVPVVIEVAAPTFTPAAQEFDGYIDVTLTAEDGATIYYNYDNSENWNEYSAALHITETTTVYAKAVKDDVASAVVSATYTKSEPVEAIMTLAEVNNDNVLEVGSEFTFGGAAVVTAQQGGYLWVRDATGYGLIYGKINGEENLTFTNGQVLNPNWTAKKTVFNGLTEYTNSMSVSASDNTDTDLAAPQEITELSAGLINAYVVVKNITSFTVNGRNVTANLSDGSTMIMYNQFNTVITNIPTEEGNYTVYGAVGRYAKDETDQIQLYILQIDGAVTPPEPEAVDVNNFNEAYTLDSGTKVNMYNDVVAVYQRGNRLWVRDSEGTSGLIYGALNATFEKGDVLSDGWTATYELFNNDTPEFTNPTGITASGDTREVAPYKRTTITPANINEYIIMEGLTLQPDATNTKRFYAADGLVFFNNFNVTIPTVEEGKTYDVIGLVTMFNGDAQVYILEMTESAAAGLRGDVNDDQTVNISDVTVLIDYLLGSADANDVNQANADCNLDGGIDISDVTVLIDYLLSGAW